MLEHQLERLHRCQQVDNIVVATSTLQTDDAIVELVGRIDGVDTFRGSETDVLGRYMGAAEAHDAQVVVRVTADCPLIDPRVVDSAIALFERHQPEVGYVSNAVRRSYPRGLDVEVFSIEGLRTAFDEAHSPPDREHVTPFIRRHPERFPSVDLVDSEDHSDLRWTVDTPEDFELVTAIYERLYPLNPAFGYRDALGLIQAEPELKLINQHVQQKET